MYEIVVMTNGTKMIHRLTDGAWIPNDERNGDYIRYLSWVADGNVAPEVETPTYC